MHKQFFIRAGGQIVEVTQEVYLVYYRSKRRDRYFERDLKTERPIRRKGCVIGYAPAKEDSLDRLMDAGEQFAAVQESVESTVILGLMADDLHKALDELIDADRDLIDALFFHGMTEREYADALGVSQPSVNERKRRILARLKNFIENHPIKPRLSMDSN